MATSMRPIVRRQVLQTAAALLAAAASGRAMTPVLAQRAPDRELLVVTDQRPVYGGTPQQGGTLRLARSPLSTSDFNPAAFRMDYQVAAMYLDSLLRPDDLTMEPQPWLAESWEVADGGRTITYQLRDDGRWHDGTPLTASDVRFSYEVYKDDIQSAVVNQVSLLDDVAVIDERTVQVRLLSNDPTWLFNASTLPIMPTAQYETFWQGQPVGARTLSDFDWKRATPMGSGPWVIERWSDRQISFSRNADYWASPPWFDRLELRWEESANRRLEAWLDGDLDILWPVAATELDDLQGHGGRLYAVESAEVMFAAFNFANPDSPIAGVLDDPSVRQALSLGVDRQAIGRDVFAGFARSFATGTIAQPWAHASALQAPRRSLAAAAQLLDAAGWVDYNGDGLRERADGALLSLMLIYRADSPPVLVRTLARVKLDLAALGVVLVLEPLSPGTFETRWRESRDFDLIAYSYGLYPGFTDYDLYGAKWDIRRNAFGWNPGGYANETADVALDTYLAATTVSAQRAALRQLQRAVNDDLFGLWLGFPDDLVLMASDILGYQPSRTWPLANTSSLWKSER